jgi:hypothetical protein
VVCCAEDFCCTILLLYIFYSTLYTVYGYTVVEISNIVLYCVVVLLVINYKCHCEQQLNCKCNSQAICSLVTVLNLDISTVIVRLI